MRAARLVKDKLGSGGRSGGHSERETKIWMNELNEDWSKTEPLI